MNERVSRVAKRYDTTRTSNSTARYGRLGKFEMENFALGNKMVILPNPWISGPKEAVTDIQDENQLRMRQGKKEALICQK